MCQLLEYLPGTSPLVGANGLVLEAIVLPVGEGIDLFVVGSVLDHHLVVVDSFHLHLIWWFRHRRGHSCTTEVISDRTRT